MNYNKNKYNYNTINSNNEYVSQELIDNNVYFDPVKFNKKFVQYMDNNIKKMNKDNELNVHDLNYIDNLEILPYQLPLATIAQNTTNMWIELYDNLNNNTFYEKFKKEYFFYIAITFIIFSIIFTNFAVKK